MMMIIEALQATLNDYNESAAGFVFDYDVIIVAPVFFWENMFVPVTATSPEPIAKDRKI